MFNPSTRRRKRRDIMCQKGIKELCLPACALCLEETAVSSWGLEVGLTEKFVFAFEYEFRLLLNRPKLILVHAKFP